MFHLHGNFFWHRENTWQQCCSLVECKYVGDYFVICNSLKVSVIQILYHWINRWLWIITTKGYRQKWSWPNWR